MKKLQTISLILFAILLLFPSCQQEEGAGMLKLGMDLKEEVLQKSASDHSSIYAAVITIESVDGSVVFEKEMLEILHFGGSLMTRSLELPVGAYILTEFMLVDTMGTVLWATPLKGSHLAHLVEKPLPLRFKISDGGTTSLGIQVIRVGNHPPADFGYVEFFIDFVDRFCLKVLYPYRSFTDCYPEGIMAPWHQSTLVIYKGERSIFKGVLNPGLNHYAIPLLGGIYTVTATGCKGTTIYKQEFPIRELMNSCCQDQCEPLIVRHQEDSTLLITPEGMVEPDILQGLYGFISMEELDNYMLDTINWPPRTFELHLFPRNIMDSILYASPVDCYVPREAIHEKALARVQTNSEGFYQLPMDAGKYFYLVATEEGYMLDSYISSRKPGEVQVLADELTHLDIHLMDCSRWMK